MIAVAALSVAACGEMTPDEQVRSDATIACLERADALFPVLDQMPDANEDDLSGGYQVNPAGGFHLTVKTKGKTRPLPDELACQGNLTARTIEYVELNGVTKRPNPPEIWKF